MLSDVLSDVLYKQCSLQVFIILIAGVICFWTISDQNKVIIVFSVCSLPILDATIASKVLWHVCSAFHLCTYWFGRKAYRARLSRSRQIQLHACTYQLRILPGRRLPNLSFLLVGSAGRRCRGRIHQCAFRARLRRSRQVQLHASQNCSLFLCEGA